MRRGMLGLTCAAAGFLCALGVQDLSAGAGVQGYVRWLLADDVVLKKAGETNLVLSAEAAASDATLKLKTGAAPAVRFRRLRRTRQTRRTRRRKRRPTTSCAPTTRHSASRP